MFWGLEASGDGYRKTTDAAVDHAKFNPPRGTRAQGRGELIKLLINQHSHMSYLIDWIGFRLNKTDDPFLMLDPFISYKEDVVEHMKQFESGYSTANEDLESKLSRKSHKNGHDE